MLTLGRHILVGKAQQQEHEAEGHTVSSVRKQKEMNSGVQHTLCFKSSQAHSQQTGAAHSPQPTAHSRCCPQPTADRPVLPTLGEGNLLSSVKPFWKHPQRHSQSCVSMVFINPIKQTMRTDQNNSQYIEPQLFLAKLF